MQFADGRGWVRMALQTLRQIPSVRQCRTNRPNKQAGALERFRPHPPVELEKGTQEGQEPHAAALGTHPSVRTVPAHPRAVPPLKSKIFTSLACTAVWRTAAVSRGGQGGYIHPPQYPKNPQAHNTSRPHPRSHAFSRFVSIDIPCGHLAR